MRSMWDYFGRRGVPVAARLILVAASLAVILQTAPQFVSAQQMAYDPTVLDGATTAPAPRPVAPAPTPAQVEQQPNNGTARLSALQIRRELSVPHWLRPGEYVWNDDDAPRAGATVIVANIRARVLSVYRDGVEIGRSNIVYGADNKPTPTGTFPILEKDADRWSRTYDAPMPHALRLTADWIAIHGSDASGDDAATRGCIGLPREFAALLFDAVRVGDRVIVWDGVTSA